MGYYFRQKRLPRDVTACIYTYVSTYKLFAYRQFLVTISSVATELFFDADELVVLSHTVGAAQRTSLNLTRVGSYSDVGDSSILGFARTV